MSISNKYSREIAGLKKKLRKFPASFLVYNIAATYRIAGSRRRAFEWWRRAAAKPWRDGSAAMELGYCYQYGIGVRQDSHAACLAYRAAVRSRFIDEYSREEALYHLAVAYLDLDGGARGRRNATKLLNLAAKDGDYPQASVLLDSVKNLELLSICRCRRFLKRSLGGKKNCPIHATKAKFTRAVKHKEEKRVSY